MMGVSRKNSYENSPGTLPIALLLKHSFFDSNFPGAAYHLTPLNTVQKRILVLMEVPLESYDGLVT
jgi:hypothetical protein